MTARPDPAIELTGVHYAHPGGRARVTDVHLSIGPAQVACLLGPNGAGKTTVLRLLLGLLTPDRGSVRVGGDDLRSLGARQRARRIAYVPQSTQTAFPFTALDMAVMGRTPHLGSTGSPGPRDRRDARRVLADLGIERIADQAFASLSGGERALTMVARAIVQEAQMLVLDEPTAALDLGNAARVLDVVADLARTGRTVVMTTHQPDHALRGADVAVLLADGRVEACGPPREVLTADRLSRVYGTPVHVGSLRVDGRADPVPVCVTGTDVAHPAGQRAAADRTPSTEDPHPSQRAACT